jgi:hypothetical protein
MLLVDRSSSIDPGGCHISVVGSGAALMPEKVADPPSLSCYHLFPRVE